MGFVGNTIIPNTCLLEEIVAQGRNPASYWSLLPADIVRHYLAFYVGTLRRTYVVLTHLHRGFCYHPLFDFLNYDFLHKCAALVNITQQANNLMLTRTPCSHSKEDRYFSVLQEDDTLGALACRIKDGVCEMRNITGTVLHTVVVKTDTVYRVQINKYGVVFFLSRGADSISNDHIIKLLIHRGGVVVPVKVNLPSDMHTHLCGISSRYDGPILLIDDQKKAGLIWFDGDGAIKEEFALPHRPSSYSTLAVYETAHCRRIAYYINEGPILSEEIALHILEWNKGNFTSITHQHRVSVSVMFFDQRGILYVVYYENLKMHLDTWHAWHACRGN